MRLFSSPSELDLGKFVVFFSDSWFSWFILVYQKHVYTCAYDDCIKSLWALCLIVHIIYTCSYRTYCMCFHILHHYLEFQSISSGCSLNTVVRPGKWRPWCVMLPPTRRPAWSVVYSVLATATGSMEGSRLGTGIPPSKMGIYPLVN